jgi:hypothetical protein
VSDRKNQLATAILAGKLLADGLKGTAERAELAELMADDDDKQKPIRDAEGTELGTATLSGGKEQAKVTNEAELLEWVKVNRPDQLRQVVEPAYVKALLNAADKEGAAVDETTGEVIPGIEVETTKAFVNIRPNDLARERMAALVAESGLLQLTKARRVVAEAPVIEGPAFAGLDDEEESPW